MSEPQRTPPAPADGDPEREALIEKLLLAGLDHYFEGSYEQAVNVWTRVAFLERGHDRARAYIERARGALAERQRQTEELLHSGIEAYEAGDLTAARELLTRVVADGGGNETALVFLQRLGRLQILEPSRSLTGPPGNRNADGAPPVERRSRRRAIVRTATSGPRPSWIATAAASLVVAGTILFAAQPIASWLGERPIAAPSVASRPDEPLPIARAAELHLARARTLYTAGRHLDALIQLERVGEADPLRPESDRLQAEIQRAILTLRGRPATIPLPAELQP
jgi:hypothetical protein